MARDPTPTGPFCMPMHLHGSLQYFADVRAAWGLLPCTADVAGDSDPRDHKSLRDCQRQDFNSSATAFEEARGAPDGSEVPPALAGASAAGEDGR